MTTSVAGGRLPRSSGARWFYALKPASWPKLIVPALFGQLLGSTSVGRLDLVAFAWGVAYTGFGLAFIVLLNDWGDRDVDAVKRRMFPEGCSPKTIPDGILGPNAVRRAGVLCGLGSALSAAGAQAMLGRPGVFVVGLGCMLVFVAYTLPPLRLNYRGGGELLEMVGVGVALPLYNVYLQSGVVDRRVWPWIAGFAALSLASAVASGLADEESDRAGGKRTVASTRGNAAARRLTEASVVVGAALWAFGALRWPDWVPAVAAVPALALVAWNFRAMRKLSSSAVTNAFATQGAYKGFLHRAIWHSTTVAAVVLWLRSSLA